MKSLPLCVAAIGVLLLGGCVSSRWERTFESEGVVPPKREPGAAVRVVNIPWERMAKSLEQSRQRLADSDAHFADWTEQEKAAYKVELLRGLQVGGDPATIEILGRSVFRSTEGFDRAPLEAFGRKVGATMVVWSGHLLGKTETVRSEAVTEWRTGTVDRTRRDGTRGRSDYSESSTTWVPVRVQADEYEYVAFYLWEMGK